MRRARVVVLVLVLLGGVGYAFAPPVRKAVLARRTRAGQRPSLLRDSATDAKGGVHPILAADSETLVYLLDAACTKCREAAPRLGADGKWAAIQGIAVRVLLPNPADSIAQFGELAGEGPPMLAMSRPWFHRLGVQGMPATLLLGRTGEVLAKWQGIIPPRVAILGALERIPR